MEGGEDIYTSKYQNIINQLLKRKILIVDIHDIVKKYSSPRELEMHACNIILEMSYENIVINYTICYHLEKILFYWEDNMEGIFTIKIPYESRSSYFDIIFKINKLVDIDGISALFVNNNPYNLEAYFVVETVHYAEKINEIIKAHDLKVNNEKGFNEFMKDITLKKWNIAILSKNMDKLEIENTISRRFIFAEKDELIKDGMGDSGFIRKKVFISYCHVNKDIIYDVCDHLEVLGVNMWLDKKAIDIGENIQRRILEGIQESDIAILFLSNATKKSNFAQHELENIMAARTKKDKNWYLVKVDDVNLDDILYGLSNYKYYDFQNNSSIEELAEDIKRYIDSTDI